MIYLRKADERGHLSLNWLDSYHSFSFGNYYDPEHMGFSALRVINDDTVAPGAGFDTHGHRDMEIVTYVLAGSIVHKDALGHEQVLSAGEVQRMTAGTGILHSEFNGSAAEALRFLQIWIVPDEVGLTPGYEQRAIAQSGCLTPLVTPSGEAGSLKLHQDASIYRLQMGEGQRESMSLSNRAGYLHVIEGKFEVISPGVDGLSLVSADAAGFVQLEEVEVSAQSDEAVALWFDLPLGVH